MTSAPPISSLIDALNSVVLDNHSGVYNDAMAIPEPAQPNGFSCCISCCIHVQGKN